MLQVGTEEKREPWSLLSLEFGRNRLTTQETATSAWWILPNVALARMRLKSFIQTFLLPLPQYHTAPSCLFPITPKKDQPSSGDSSRSDSEEDIGDPDYVFTDALRREGHTSLTRKTSTI